MEIKMTGRDIRLTRPLREYIRKRLERVQRHVPRVMGVDAVLRMERTDHVAELRLNAPDINLNVSGRSNDMYASIDDAIAKLERAARRAKERRTNSPRVLAAKARESLPPPAAEEEEEDFEVVKVTNLEVKPMSVEEAILQMRTLSFAFFVFRDAMDDFVKVIYRRSDKKYGLIEPDVL